MSNRSANHVEVRAVSFGRDVQRSASGWRVAVAFAALLCLMLAAPALAQTTSSDVAHQQFVFAYRLLQQGEDKLAIDAFDKYLGSFPRDEKRGDGLYFRALLARRVGNNEAAAEFLSDMPATRLVPDHKVLLLKGQVHLTLEQYDRALEALERINITNLDDTTKATTSYMRGTAYRGQNNLDAAITHLTEAAKPDTALRARSLLDLARTQVAADKGSEAIDTLRRCIAIENATVAPEAARLAGDLSYQAEDYREAITFYNIVLTRFTSSPQFDACVVGLFWSYYSANQYTELARAFDQFKDKLSTDSRLVAWYLAGSAAQNQGNHARALGILRGALESARGTEYEEKILYKIANSEFEIGDYDRMATTVQTFLTRHADSTWTPDVEFLLAAAERRQGNPAKAAALLTAIVNRDGGEHAYADRALLERAKLYELTGQREPAVRDYERLVSSQFGDVSGHMVRLIDLYFQLEQYEQVNAIADQLLGGEAVYEVDLPAIEPVIEQEVLYRKALSRIHMKLPASALETLDDLLQKHPQNKYLAEAHYYRGLLRMSQERPDEAVADFRAAAAVTDARALPEPLKVNALRLSAVHLRRLDDAAQAAATLAALEKLVGLDRLQVDEQLWMAGHLLSAGDAKTALRYVQPIITKRDAHAGRVRAEALMLAGRALRDLGNPDRAINSFAEVIAIGKGFELEARLELAKTNMLAGDDEEALAMYQGLTASPDIASDVAARAHFDSGSIYRRQAERKARAGDDGGAAELYEKARESFNMLTILYDLPVLSPLPELGFIEAAEVTAELEGVLRAVNFYNRLAAHQTYGAGPYGRYAKAMSELIGGRKSVALQMLKLLQREEGVDARLMDRVSTQLKAMEGGG